MKSETDPDETRPVNKTWLTFLTEVRRLVAIHNAAQEAKKQAKSSETDASQTDDCTDNCEDGRDTGLRGPDRDGVADLESAL